MDKATILVVEDERDIAELISLHLKREGHTVTVVENGENAVQQVESQKFDLIIVDWMLPGVSGLDLCKKWRAGQDTYASKVPIFMVTARAHTSDIVLGLEMGADDYITKPFKVVELLARVRAQLRIKDLNDKLTKANERLKELVDIDDLTGLFNMRSLYKKLDFELDRARRHDRSIAVIMMDVDHFKKVNDHHDHLFGSWVLSQIGKMIRENIRKIDFAARYGGDEYLVVLSEINREGTMVFTQRLREKIAARTFTNDNFSINLTASFGVAVVNPNQNNVDARELVRLADKGLYLAKENGRNRVEVYEAK
jgi:diguanylate cyclase (GGDEF)-like protein